MSRHTEVTEALINRFLNNKPLVNGQPLENAKIKFPNAPFTTPEDDIWVRLTVTKGRGINIAAGYNGLFRTPGVFIVDIFAPKGSGDREANEIAGQVDDLYRKQFFDNIRADETQVDSLGEEDAWYQTQVSVFFNYDDC